MSTLLMESAAACMHWRHPWNLHQMHLHSSSLNKTSVFEERQSISRLIGNPNICLPSECTALYSRGLTVQADMNSTLAIFRSTCQTKNKTLSHTHNVTGHEPKETEPSDLIRVDDNEAVVRMATQGCKSEFVSCCKDSLRQLKVDILCDNYAGPCHSRSVMFVLVSNKLTC